MKHPFLGLWLILLSGLLIGQNTIAQQVRFKSLGREQGICDPFIYTINQDKNGFIFLGTGEGICRFDGFSFKSLDEGGDSISQAYVSASYETAGCLWFGHNDGSLTRWDGIKMKPVRLPDKVTSQINQITSDRDGNIWIITQSNGVACIGPSMHVTVYDTTFAGKLLYCGTIGRGGEFLIGANDGLYLYTLPGDKEGFRCRGRIGRFPETKVQNITWLSSKESWIAGTEDQGFLLVRGTGFNPSAYQVSDISSVYNLSHNNIQAVMRDIPGNLWLATQGSGVYELLWNDTQDDWTEIRHFSTEEGLENNYVKCLFQDREGQVWFGTYGSGLAILNNEALRFYNYSSSAGGNITAVASSSSALWIAGDRGILEIAYGTKSVRLLKTTSELSNDVVSSLFVDPLGNIWAGTMKSGLWKLEKSASTLKRVCYSSNSLENTVNFINGKNDEIYAATNGGLIVINLKTGTQKIYDMSTGLLHNVVNSVYIDRRNEIWLASPSQGIYNFSESHLLNSKARGEIGFTGITQDAKGNYWASTEGQGIFCFKKDTVIQITTAHGLASNYGYSITSDEGGSIWVGHRMAVSRIDPARMLIHVYERREGISGDCNPHAMISDVNGVVWIGTTEGLLGYDVRNENKKHVPPIVNIISLRINDREYDIHNNIVLPYGSYKLRIDYIGLNYRAPERVAYQYKLEGFDADWMEPTSVRYVNYSNVRDGSYKFLLRACDDQGNCSESAVMFSLHIRLPIWKQWWFILIMITVIVIVVIGIIKYREKQLLEFNRMLEIKLDERTREVVQQKEEIEIKNREILDSIAYAKRIQQSMLPSVGRLQEISSGYFIFYQPKDLVSGDFYWFDKVSSNRFLVVCADSTGHGVPGGFMSVMGTTLVKDICYRSDLDSPSEMLALLDREIHARLNQNIDAERSNDGMDIIICEINMDTLMVRIASAMRPFILYINGEQIYVQGSRSSIGGTIEIRDDKVFEDRSYQMSKGDLIYMFSDGYTDQFGGPLGKKFKMVRLRNLLKDINQKPMMEQYNYVKNNFNLWRGDQPQIDDVLFIGIQI